MNIPRHISSRGEGSRGRFGGGGGGGGGADLRQRRRERIDELKQQFRRALAYDKVRDRGPGAAGGPAAPDPSLAALVPYAKGEKPVIFRAEHRNEILDALKIAEELKLKAVISGGADAWKVAEALKAANVPGPDRRHAPAPHRADRPLRRRLRQPRPAARGRRHVRDPLQRRRPRAGDRRPQPALRSRHRRRLRPARGRGA